MRLHLSEDELAILLEYARPLYPEDRDQFLQAVLTNLQKQVEINLGVITGIARELQQKFFIAPDIVGISSGQ